MGREEGKSEGDADDIGKVCTVVAGATVLEERASPAFLRRGLFYTRWDLVCYLLSIDSQVV